MPDFVAASLASAVFCLAIIALNALTRLALQAPFAPDGLAENGFLQYGGALALAGTTYRRAMRLAGKFIGE
ncbi:hypothetical protein [Methylorubrum extorquens]|uniref:hypothetical protein n=1 Tax=Methylorubrum extorquens TaxID=408 RepID=UPI000159078F|nr:hypothetical protein [Methylorubrum extorquens]ABY31836.1 hypothetical protein Mext_3450 [Methylorubrum extorquens PA1]KQP87102.1 hypothetical protein ASF55_11980 [Methylobacterium sp. Leaf119]WIU38456.1 hypothetical protein KQ926_17850 [Methylorubrum extorquens]